jgi:hypothetical protein
MPLVMALAHEVFDVRQLGSAILAVIIMLACAALSEQFIPAVASQEPEAMAITRTVVADPVVAAHAAGVPLLHHPAERALRPQIPEQLVMLLAGVFLMGLGGALRTPRCER